VAYENREPLMQDIAHLKDAVGKSKPVEAFMNAASPGVLTKFVPDAYYKSEDAYIAALADAMKEEYEAIHEAGYLLQIDCPDLGSARHNQYQDLSDEAFLKIAERNVEAVNHDIPLAKVFGVLMKARPAGILFEGANPRHEHEWEDIKDAQIPDHKVLIPGVVDSTSNFVEHPRLIAQRICRYADIVGRERVIAGTDCGFGTFVRREPIVATSVVWSKFRAMAEGAALATGRLWSSAA
jgi:5-methyltetrahydropteroyltriglutamate--homocysteine methyltransferase